MLTHKASKLRNVDIVRSADMPGFIESARCFIQEDGLPVIDVSLVNPTTEPLERIEVTAVVHTKDGRRRGMQTAELPPEAFPIEGRQKRTLHGDLTPITVLPTDYVTVAVTGATTSSTTWAYLNFISDADRAFLVPEVNVISPHDAPVQVSDVKLTRGSTGAPQLVSYVLRNEGEHPVSGVVVHVLLIDSNRTLRRELIGRHNVAILRKSGVPETVSVHDANATADWKVVVALAAANTEDGRWLNPDIKRQALESLMPKPRWPD